MRPAGVGSLRPRSRRSRTGWSSRRPRPGPRRPGAADGAPARGGRGRPAPGGRGHDGGARGRSRAGRPRSRAGRAWSAPPGARAPCRSACRPRPASVAGSRPGSRAGCARAGGCAWWRTPTRLPCAPRPAISRLWCSTSPSRQEPRPRRPLADRVVLVAGPDAEPALAVVVAESLGVVGPPPVVVAQPLRPGHRAVGRRAPHRGARVTAGGPARRGGAGAARSAGPGGGGAGGPGGPGLMRPAALRDQSGQALVLGLVVVTVLLAGFGVLAGFGQALGGKSRQQRGADLAAMSAAGRMRGRLPAAVRAAAAGQRRRPTHATCRCAVYLARARAAAVRGARRNGITLSPARVTLPGRHVRAHARGGPRDGRRTVRVGQERERIPVAARAEAEISPDAGVPLGMPGHGSGRRLRRPAGLPDGQAHAARRGRRPSTGWRPRRAGTGSSSPSPARSARTPSRRGCSPRTPTRSGSRRPGPACTDGRPSSTSGRPAPTRG